uniref:Uncharacterized protein n=1 Tax=Ditylenchus dipsaci TaxID=166011 RepID=A0A915DAY5_9BILA
MHPPAAMQASNILKKFPTILSRVDWRSFLQGLFERFDRGMRLGSTIFPVECQWESTGFLDLVDFQLQFGGNPLELNYLNSTITAATPTAPSIADLRGNTSVVSGFYQPMPQTNGCGPPSTRNIQYHRQEQPQPQSQQTSRCPVPSMMDL